MIPGAAPRYTLPVMTPFCWLLGMAFSGNAFRQPDWLRWPENGGWLRAPGAAMWNRVALVFVGLGLAVGLIVYPAGALAAKYREEMPPSIRRYVPQPKVRNIAERINAVVPASETLYAVDPNYQPLFFYIAAPVKYVRRLEDLPPETKFFLVRPDNEDKASTLPQWAPAQARQLVRVKDYRKQTVIVFRVERG